MGATRTLARWIDRTGPGDLPDELAARGRSYLVDALAAAVVGRDARWTRIAATQAQRRGGVAEATAIGVEGAVPTTSATWVNAMAVGACELDHGAHQAHPASTVLPAALAVAEARGSSGRETLTAVLVGYEIACRVGAAGTRAIEDERGFHNPGTNGPFGAAAAAGKLLGLGEDRLASALGIAGSACGGLTEYLHDGSMTKRLHLAAAARGGLEAAELSQDGFTGPATVLEGEDGFLRAFSPAPRPELLTDALGETFLCSDLTIKGYPAHGAVQSMIAALSAYREREPGAAAVDRVHLRLAPGDRLRQQRFHVPRPATIVEAQYSLEFAAAVALVRDLRDPTQFGEDVLDDAAVRHLAALVSWSPTEEPASVVEVSSAGRTTELALRAARGSAADPMGPEDIAAKFHRHTEHALAQADRDRLLELVDGFAELPRAGVVLQTLNAALSREDPR